MKPAISFCLIFYFICSGLYTVAQKKALADDAKKAMLDATKYMVEQVSVNGGYVGTYLPDLSRRWGELEFYKTKIQVQSDGVVSMGNIFLDAYAATGDEYYYQAAEKAAKALIWGQLPCGGWNYIIDFAGDRSLKNWYNTIGKNAWGFEEFNHYYGNATFDDVTTSDAAKFLLRIYLQKLDISYKPALDKAIAFVLESQYPLGGWPQRYPLKYDYPHHFKDDYTSFYTFNDDVIWGNIDFLIQCYVTLGEERLLDPIKRGMNFYLITQQGNPQGGWGLQYDMDLKPAHARSYEPPALVPSATYEHCMLLLRFYEYTGDRRFLARIPDAIEWLENSRLPQNETGGGRYTHPVFIEAGTNKALYAHRSGTGVIDGRYWYDYKDEKPLLHYGAKTNVPVEKLKEEYKRIASLSPQEATKNSPLKIESFQNDITPQQYYETAWPLDDGPDVARRKYNASVKIDESQVRKIINSLDAQHRWMVKHIQISRPYAVTNDGVETNTAKLSDEGGRGIMDASDQEYLSTREYMKNMQLLINYIKQKENPVATIKETPVYEVLKAAKPVKIDGNWNKREWKNIKAANIANYMGKIPAFRPVAAAKMMYDEENLYLIFQVKDRFVQCVTLQYNGPVWKDAAVEFFFSPDTDTPGAYFNLEINCGGTALMGYHNTAQKKSIQIDSNDIKKIEIAHSLPKRVYPEIVDPVTWTIECKIPLRLLEKYATITTPGRAVAWRANFYKIAEQGSNPHYITWSLVNNPKPNFHLPEFFGVLKFHN